MSCLSSWQKGTRKGRKRVIVCLTGVRQAMTTDCRSACQTGFCPSGSLSVGVQRAREECVCPCKYHNFQSKECEATTHIKKFSKATEHPSMIVCAAVYMSPQPSPKFTVTSIKWQLKGTVVNSAGCFPDSKVLLCRGAPFGTC